MLDDSCWKRLAEIVGGEYLTFDTARLNGRWPGAAPKAIVRPIGNRSRKSCGWLTADAFPSLPPGA
jgi:hypothetical protein